MTNEELERLNDEAKELTDRNITYLKETRSLILWLYGLGITSIFAAALLVYGVLGDVNLFIDLAVILTLVSLIAMKDWEMAGLRFEILQLTGLNEIAERSFLKDREERSKHAGK